MAFNNSGGFTAKKPNALHSLMRKAEEAFDNASHILEGSGDWTTNMVVGGRRVDSYQKVCQRCGLVMKVEKTGLALEPWIVVYYSKGGAPHSKSGPGNMIACLRTVKPDEEIVEGDRQHPNVAAYKADTMIKDIEEELHFLYLHGKVTGQKGLDERIARFVKALVKRVTGSEVDYKVEWTD